MRSQRTIPTRRRKSGNRTPVQARGSRACPGVAGRPSFGRRVSGPRAPPSISRGRGASDGRPSRPLAFATFSGRTVAQANAKRHRGSDYPHRGEWTRRNVVSSESTVSADEGTGGDGLHRAREALLLNSAVVQSQPSTQGSMLKHWPWLLNLGLTNCAQPPALHASLPRTRYVTLAVVMFPAASTAVAVKSFEPIVPVDSVAG